MTDTPQKPNNIILSAKLRQELTLDKTAMAEWAQNTFERLQLAHGITKQEIDSGLCRYTYNYEQFGMLMEEVMQALIDKGLNKGLKTVAMQGGGSNTQLDITMDLREAQAHPLRIINAPGYEGEPLSPSQLRKEFTSTIFFEDGFILDAGRLVGALKSLETSLEHQQQKQHDAFNNADPIEKKHYIADMNKATNNILKPFGMDFTTTDGKTAHVSLHFDRLMQFAEKHSSTDRGYAIKREANGTASILVDYRRLVDLAFEKAQQGIEKMGAQNYVEITDNEMDSVKLGLQSGDMKSIWNGLISKATDTYIAMLAERQGHLREALGTVAEPKQQIGRNSGD